ncbi:MAG: aminotransferase class V-fold PLP-dependent enzyme [Ardenticatenales bacterium]|nr:aminotransferase class V-fold PLP-dependent enzyme [Ardenticatenales bacterium]
MTSLIPGSDAARALFPITAHTAFLNHASASPLSTRVFQAMHGWLEWWQQHGGRDDFPAPLAEYRATLARVIGATPEEIAIIPNTSEGLLLVAQGFPWQPGDALLTTEGEFTANVYPWNPLRERGVEIIRLPARDHRLPLEDVEAAFRTHPNIRLLALSFVQFATGARNDLAALGALCRQYDVRFCVDAIQGAGALPIDVREMGIDFLSAAGPKWLMGPIGAGIFFVRRELLEQLRSGHHGWISTTEVLDFFRYDAPLVDTAARFEAGTLPWPSLIGFVASVETLLEVGIPNIERHVLGLGDVLIAGLLAKGYTIATPLGPGERSGIVSFSDPRRPAAEVAAHLDAQKITVSARGPFVRVSPHFYNNREDIERVLAAL